MKLFKSMILFFAVAFTFMSAGAQNVSINVLTQNSGLVNLNGAVFVEITIANTSTTTAVPNYKLRPQLSVPVSIVSIPATGHILPSGWTIISNAAGVIRVSNGTDQIPANTARTILIAIQGNTLGGPQTVSGNLLFSNGVAPGSASGPATSGDVTADNSSSSTVEVVQGPSCSVAVSASAGTIACNGGSTTLTATATGANGAVEYSLNGGAFQSGNTFSVNAAGSPYTVTVRETGNVTCTATSAAVTVIEPSAIVVFATAGNIACNAGTTTLAVTATGGTGTLQYSLNGGAFQAGNTFTVNAAGSPYTVTVRDANLCSIPTNTLTVSEPTSLNATASAGTVLCNAGTTILTVTATGGTGALQYSLNGGAFQAGNTFTVNAAGSPFTVTVKDNNNCTITTSAVTVTEPTALTASASSTPVTTTGGSDGTATAIPSGGTPSYTYLWSPGGQTTITATGLSAGSFTVTVTDANGCTTSANTSVGSPTCSISVSASAGTIACNGGTSIITATATGASGAVEYSLNGGAFQSGNTFTVNVSGSPYTITSREVANPSCSATSNAVAVTEPSSILVNGSVTTAIANTGGTGTITVIASGGTGAISYVITTGTTINTTGATSGVFTNLGAGSYTFIATDANGCTVTSLPVVLTEPGSLPLSATIVKNDVSVCGGFNDGSITVTTTGGTAPYSYSWTGITGSNQTPFSAGNVSSINNLNYGFYNVTVTDAALNTVTISNIHVIKAFAVFITNNGSNSSSCAPTGSMILYGNAGVLPYSYSIDGTTYQVSNVFTGLAAGTYTGYVKDAAGCVSQKSITIGTSPAIQIVVFAFPASSCANDGSIEIYKSGGIPGFSYSLDNVTYQVSNKFLNLPAAVYTAWVKDSKGCTASQSVTVTQGVALSVTASKTNSSVCLSDGTIQVNASGGVAPYSYNLNGGLFQSGNSFIGLAAGVYSVSVKDSKGCIGTLNVTIGSNQINVTVYTLAASSCATSNGALQLFRTSGVGPFMYSINGNTYQSSNTFTGLTAGTYTGFVKDSKGCTGMLAGIVVGPAACGGTTVSTLNKGLINNVSDLKSKEIKVQAYPNPSATEFMVALEGFSNTKVISITVTDILGKVVYQTKAVAKLQFKFGSSFIAGTYVLQVIQGNERKSLKIVKE